MAMTATAFVGRVGGLAVAFGIGTAVAIGMASAAAASPDEPGSGASSSPAVRAADGISPQAPARGPRASAVAASSRAASATGPRRASTERVSPESIREVPAPAGSDAPDAGPPASPAPAVEAVPAQAVRREAGQRSASSSAGAVRVAPAAAEPLPAPAAPASGVAPAAAQAAAAPSGVAPSVAGPSVAAAVRPAVAASRAVASRPPAATAVSRFLSLFAPDSRGRKITIYQGTHFAIPNNFGFFIRRVNGTGTFTANTTYDLKDEDQFDWNKFTGIAFTPLEPDRDSAMVGWRYNLTTREFEIAPFYNVGKRRILPSQAEVISVPADETFQYLVDYTGVTLSYGERTVFKPYPEGLTPNVWTAARVSGWFGGNEVAPRTISYFIKFT